MALVATQTDELATPINMAPPRKPVHSKDTSDSGGVFKVPRFAADDKAVSIARRQAARLNALSISSEEHESLLGERRELLKKKYEGSFTRRDEVRLEYVRWHLDRIEDAHHGHHLDQLETAITMYERFAHEISELQRQLQEASSTRKR